MGDHRRQEILKLLRSANLKPISGSDMAKELGVSRQVIVQDISLLRAKNYNIIATTKGYIILE